MARAVALATVAVLLPGLALGQQGGPATSIPGVDRIPPAFDHPYTGHLYERAASLTDVIRLCHELGVAGEALGCSVHGMENGRPACAIIYYRGGASTRRHELAHCNGWSHP